MTPARQAWESALESYRAPGVEHARRYRIAHHRVEVRSPSPDLLETMTRALEHLRDDAPGPCDLSVRLWSDPVWRGPWQEGDQVARGLLPGWCSPELTAVHDGTLTASLVDHVRGRALHWIRRPEELADQLAAPLLSVFYLFFRARGLQLLHGAALGLEGEGFLLLGPGRAGKSSVALDALGHLAFAGDDYVLVDPEGPTAYSLYRTLKVRDQEVRWLEAGLAHRLALRAAVVCVPGEELSLTRCSRAQVLAGTAAGSLMLFPDAGQPDLERLSRILSRLECYRLSRGPKGPARAQMLLERTMCQG